MVNERIYYRTGPNASHCLGSFYCDDCAEKRGLFDKDDPGFTIEGYEWWPDRMVGDCDCESCGKSFKATA